MAVLDKVGLGHFWARLKGIFTNQNLLHNWYFPSLVNQRTANSYASAGYCIDRWYLDSGASLSVTANGITLTAGASEAGMYQRFENQQRLFGKTLTGSIKINGVVYSGTATIPSDYASGAPVIVFCTFPGGLLRFTHGATYANFGVRCNPGQSLAIESIKLELGNISTLANDPPMDYGKELAVCQRFYEKSYGSTVTPGTAPSFAGAIVYPVVNNAVQGNISFKVEKRATPTIALYSPQTGAVGNGCYYRTSSYVDIPLTTTYNAPPGFVVNSAVPTDHNGGIRLHWTASADL